MDILTYINRMNQIYGNEPAPVRYNTQQYLQGGRVGYKPGGIVEPGVTHYGKTTKTKRITNRQAKEIIKTPNAPGKPEWFDSLVTRVINEGDDVTKQFAYKERMQVNTKQISPTEEVTVYRDLDDGSVRINYGAKMRIDETKP